ncbi:MAG: polymer-forming cytoskeletal protein [Anaerolineales bacterium]|nr:polymer-forming cytoskeletal protein [Anaerolineales bacterium]
MKKTFKFYALLMLFALLFLPTSSAQAQGPSPDGDGQVIFGSNFTLESGDVFDGDLVLLGGNVTIEEDASLNGSLVVVGGTIRSDGEIDGDVVVVGGQISLEEAALVTGDVVTIGGQLNRAEGARIEGQVVNNVAPNITVPPARIPPTAPAVPDVPNVLPPNFNVDVFNPVGRIFGIFSWAVGLAAFGMLLALFWQPQIERTGNAIISQPLMTGAIGLAAIVVAAIFFFTILPLFIVALAWFFGVVAIGQEVGERFTKAINQTWSPVLTIGFGTFLLVLAGGVIGSVPCLGGLTVFLFGLVGIGASVITLFGVRSIQVPALTTYTPPADAGQAPPVG